VLFDNAGLRVSAVSREISNAPAVRRRVEIVSVVGEKQMCYSDISSLPAADVAAEFEQATGKRIGMMPPPTPASTPKFADGVRKVSRHF